MVNQCLICGRDIPLDERQFVTCIGDKFFNYCVCHEGSKEVKRISPLIKQAIILSKQNEAYKTTLDGVKRAIEHSNVDYFNKKLEGGNERN